MKMGSDNDTTSESSSIESLYQENIIDSKSASSSFSNTIKGNWEGVVYHKRWWIRFNLSWSMPGIIWPYRNVLRPYARNKPVLANKVLVYSHKLFKYVLESNRISFTLLFSFQFPCYTDWFDSTPLKHSKILCFKHFLIVSLLFHYSFIVISLIPKVI